jgi:hypothetical protein
MGFLESSSFANSGICLNRNTCARAETVAAVKEIEAGGGQIVNGSTEDAFDEILGE